MTEKTHIKYVVLFFISLVTACSGSADGSFSEQQAPLTQNQPVQEIPSGEEPATGGSNPVSDGGSTASDMPVISSSEEKKHTPIALNSADGDGLYSEEGRVNQPAVLQGVEGKVIYTLGSDELRVNSADTENKRLSEFHYDDSVFLNAKNIDPSKVQTLEVKDDADNVIGTFQFVKQSYSQYMTFMPKIKRAQADGSVEYFGGIYSYLATPTSDSDFKSQTGTATYTGKVIGYVYPLSVGDKISSNYPSDDALPSRPTQAPTPADISLTVNFDSKKITGEITNRFDHLAGRSWRWTDDEDRVTQQGLDLDKKSLYLDATIVKSGDVWGFQGAAGGSDGVSVEVKTGQRAGVAGWGGIFAGDGAKEVVGVITSKENMTFGAVKND